MNERLVGTVGTLQHNLQRNSGFVHSPKMASRNAGCFQRTKFVLCVTKRLIFYFTEQKLSCLTPAGPDGSRILCHSYRRQNGRKWIF